MRWRHGDTLPTPEATPDARQPAAADLQGRLERLSSLHPSGGDYSGNTWDRAKARCTEAWQRHQERWPRPEGKPDRSRDLSPSAEQGFADGCDKIAAAERSITSRLRGIEAQEPGRSLVGLEFCLKGRDRVIDKAAEYMDELPGMTSAQALAMVPDALRYTFSYETDSYAGGVLSEIDRIKASGFEILKLKNMWHRSEYHGINSQWRDPATSHRFEVQFHTAISFEAKQLTNGVYERIRDPAGSTSRRELRQLHRLQRDITAQIPTPPGVGDIRDQG